jgi:transposase
LLSLVPSGLTVDRLLPAPDRILLLARSHSTSAACPLCGGSSTRAHSFYSRRLADLPWQGRIVELQVRVRRFRCTSLECRRRIFAERLDIARPKARRTVRLHEIQQQIGFALGGDPGSRLAGRLAMPVSGDTLLRLVRASDTAVSPPPRILGVDDWAWRRGQRYGTIICDLERRRVIDLLPDRTGETLASWLRQHGKSVAVVSRDRAGAYAEGIRSGAPQAMQVADRWHLMVNASEALRRVLDRHSGALRRAARLCLPQAVLSVPVKGKQQAATQRERQGAQRREQRQARYEEVARLHREGMPIRRIARRLGMARNAVRRWLRAGEAPVYRRAPGSSALDRHLEYVERRWAEGCHNSAQLWRELRDQGFNGGYDIVRRWAIRRRGLDVASIDRHSPLPSWRVPSSRRAARLLTTPAEGLTRADRQFVDTLTVLAPEIRAAAAAINEFGRILRERDAAAFEAWLTAARTTALHGFVTGIVSDLAAVRGALSQPWSNGPVEGQINRLKLLKRQAYGRAKFDLLRSRVLHAV